jgi:hypothetical protein
MSKETDHDRHVLDSACCLLEKAVMSLDIGMFSP